MISAPDRKRAVELIDEARTEGARLRPACAELGIGTNTYRRWVSGGVDRRPVAMRPVPSNALSAEERAQVLQWLHSPSYASLPPGQVVPRLLDEHDTYVASESSMYRILHAAGEQHHRGRAAAPKQRGEPRRHCAQAPNQVWSWDVSYLPTRVRGQHLYLYLIMDIFSRKIVGAEVFEAENMANSATVIERAVLREQLLHRPLILHADNGSPMKGSTLNTTLERLGVTPSHSRPRVSDDNAFSEALFRTCKYRPSYPVACFESLDAARQWVIAFVQWYNHEHRHSAIRFVTPAQRHAGADAAILQRRQEIYLRKRAERPERWSGKTRDWSQIGHVWLNPDNDAKLLEAA